MSRRSFRTVVRRRGGRAAGAFVVVAFTALGPQGPGLFAAAHAQAQGTARDVGGYSAAAVEVAAPGVATAPSTATVTPSDVAGADLAGAGTVSAPTTQAPATVALTPDPAAAVPPSAPSGSGIPGAVLAAYKAAESSLAASDPGCHVPWTLVAGIGRVESGNASGGRVDAAGTTRGRILGPRLDGTTAGTALIRDSDGGALDGDTAFDRAVGPMQFIPGTWKAFAKDGNNDGVASPHNVYDAALAAGSYLCAGGGDLSQPAAQRAALLRYNRSDAYGTLVLRWAAAYGSGVAVLPGESGDVPPTTPTPPAQVPTPAAGTLDSATSAALAALAAPALAVTGTVSSESSVDTEDTTTTTTPPTTTTTPTTPPTTTTTPTTPPATTTTPTSTTPPTTTRATTTPPAATTTPPAATSSSKATTTPPTTTSRRTTSATATAPARTGTTTTTRAAPSSSTTAKPAANPTSTTTKTGAATPSSSAKTAKAAATTASDDDE